jgi:hypothetical protein
MWSTRPLDQREAAEIFGGGVEMRLRIPRSESPEPGHRRFGELMKHPTLPPNAPKRKPRARIIRNESERSALNQIASFFDERERAFSFLKRNLNNGYISTPDRDLPVQDFLRVHQEAWEKRQISCIPNSIEFLRNSILTRTQTIGSISQRTAGLGLDEIERRRDSEGQYEGKYGKFPND